jgi:hypothetical protein
LESWVELVDEEAAEIEGSLVGEVLVGLEKRQV